MINLLHGDCLELMKQIPDNSIDCVLTDPPYGTTACKWDTVIDFDLMWEQLKRITKDNGAICLFGSEPFSSAVRMSNIQMFKYDWVWRKTKGGFNYAKYRPLSRHENISVFAKKKINYFPKMTESNDKRIDNKNLLVRETAMMKGNFSPKRKKSRKLNYPNTNLDFKSVWQKGMHPNQKPVALLEYLIKTYTLENETVLDFTMGSGSTGVACKNLNRKFIGIEQDEKYFNIAKDRINDL